VVEKSVQHVGCVTHCRINNLGVEGCVLVRYVRVEQHARFRAVTKVNLSGFFAATAGLKALTIRRGSGTLTPMTGEGLPMLMVNERGQGFAVGLVANVPSR
jgi:hypothetical protein